MKNELRPAAEIRAEADEINSRKPTVPYELKHLPELIERRKSKGSILFSCRLNSYPEIKAYLEGLGYTLSLTPRGDGSIEAAETYIGHGDFLGYDRDDQPHYQKTVKQLTYSQVLFKVSW